MKKRFDIPKSGKFFLICLILIISTQIIARLYILNFYKNTHVSIKGEVVEIPGEYLINFDLNQNFYNGRTVDNVFYYGLRSKHKDFGSVTAHFAENNAKKLNCEGDWWEIMEPGREVLIYDNETFFYMKGPDFQDLFENYSKVFCKPN